MTAKPRPLLGLLIGVVAAWPAISLVSYSGTKLGMLRAQRFDESLDKTLPWVLVIIAVAVVAALLLSVRTIAGGAMLGLGAVMTVAALGVQVLPIRQAVKVSQFFDIGGTGFNGYVLWDGSILFVGVFLLVLGFRRLAVDSRPDLPPMLATQPGQQDVPTYYNQQNPYNQPNQYNQPQNPYNNPPR